MAKFPLANKSFGQHFLSSSLVISKITKPLPLGTDSIIEVGPGPAVLTPYLAEYKLPISVIEMDERFLELLAPIVGQENIYLQDAMKFDWPNFLKLKNFQSIWLVSNLPYNVSVPLTLSFIRIPVIQNMTLMYQKEVAEKILPKEIKNGMNSLHALIQSQFDVRHVVNAPPGAFVPPPKVDSQVLHFTRKTRPLINLEKIDLFEDYLRLIFGQKRKQLGGILRKEWGEIKTKYVMENAGLIPNIRSEALNLKQVLNLYEIAINYSP